VEYLDEYETEDIGISNVFEDTNTNENITQEKKNIPKESNIRVEEAEGEIITNNNSRKRHKILKKELQNTIEISTKLNNIYEKTYELKKNYYEVKTGYMKRSMEALKKLVGVVEKCDKLELRRTNRNLM